MEEFSQRARLSSLYLFVVVVVPGRQSQGYVNDIPLWGVDWWRWVIIDGHWLVWCHLCLSRWQTQRDQTRGQTQTPRRPTWLVLQRHALRQSSHHLACWGQHWDFVPTRWSESHCSNHHSPLRRHQSLQTRRPRNNHHRPCTRRWPLVALLSWRPPLWMDN